jgi:FkbM family methyltransferase
MGFEWRSIRGLLESKAHPPRRVQNDDQFELWSTSLGELWTPMGANEDFVGMLVAEMNALVYDLFLLPANGAGSTVVDAGANIGVFARWALRHGVQRVICFEPSPQNAECLRRNLAVDISSGLAQVIQKGLWDSTKTLSFSTLNRNNPGAHHVAEDGYGDVTIPVTTLDETCSELDLDRIDYIKMDVEGAEQRALAGASKTIGRFRPQLCIVTEHTSDLFANAEAVVEHIIGLGAGYRYRVTESHGYDSPSRGSVLTPYSILFYVDKGKPLD